ncbi:MAG: acyl CoA:acetate/3-ketoacid CoA transferase, partial [Peptococcaceae bacterium]|nr:acyl CoA:acetate/3-ketoacid CoA transferase [Peptococcaceae bacterium]
MAQFITAQEAADLINDQATLGASGMGQTQWAEELCWALGKRYEETGRPKNITFTHGGMLGDFNGRSITYLGKEGLVKRWMGALLGVAFDLLKLLQENKLEAYCLPLGVINQLWCEIAAKRPGVITKVGLGTFVDPRIEGGKMNDVTTEDIVKLIELEGEEYLFYKSYPLDFAFIRGTTADEDGNISMSKESMKLDGLHLAQATRNSGGKVIVQVEWVAKSGTLHPKQVEIPGILVDYVVVATRQEACWQTDGVYFNPAFNGDIKIPVKRIPELPLTERKVITRRAAMELKPGVIINLGTGMPMDIPNIANEENVSEILKMTTESGSCGGLPMPLPFFGSVYNAEALIESKAQFDFYDGGGIDIGFLGLAQTDEEGNINVNKFGNRVMGIGGFINISQNAKKVVYCGTFTHGAELKIEDGKVIIVKEGKHKKFLKKVEQICYSGKYAQQVKQQVLFITERGVLTLAEGQMTLSEIAPGIDLEKDLLSMM